MSVDIRSTEEITRTLMKSAVPERAKEIDELWANYRPRVFVAGDKNGVILDATKERIEFGPKTMKVFWLIGFSGWRAIECYSPHVILSAKYGKELHELFDDDEDLPELELTYRERLASARSLIEQRDVDDILWPYDLPCPVLNRDTFDSDQHKTVYDLVVIATAFAFFHEFRHVMLDRDNLRSSDRREEELQCDVWAREFMTVKLASFANDNDHMHCEVMRKRSMGLALAALILHVITPKNSFNPHYFSIKTRLKTLLLDTKLPDNDHFWVFVASLLVGIFRAEHIEFSPTPMSPRQLAEYFLELLSD